MISFTETAREKVREYIDGAGAECIGLRVHATRRGRHSFQYDLVLVMEGEASDEDVRVDADGLAVLMDAKTAGWMEAATIDYVSDLSGAGFKIDNPMGEPRWDDPVAQRVQQVINERVMPVVASHGGWVELLDVRDDTVYLHLGGGCQGCGMASVTLTEGIETAIKEAVPEIRNIVDQTNHDAGENPFYA